MGPPAGYSHLLEVVRTRPAGSIGQGEGCPSGLYATKLREAMVAPLRYGGHDSEPGSLANM